MLSQQRSTKSKSERSGQQKINGHIDVSEVRRGQEEVVVTAKAMRRGERQALEGIGILKYRADGGQ
jgi:hypothetical protein